MYIISSQEYVLKFIDTYFVDILKNLKLGKNLFIEIYLYTYLFNWVKNMFLNLCEHVRILKNIDM